MLKKFENNFSLLSFPGIDLGKVLTGRLPIHHFQPLRAKEAQDNMGPLVQGFLDFGVLRWVGFST